MNILIAFHFDYFLWSYYVMLASHFDELIYESFLKNYLENMLFVKCNVIVM